MSLASTDFSQPEFPTSVVRPTEGVSALPRGGARIIDLVVHSITMLIIGFLIGAVLGAVVAANRGDTAALQARLSQESFMDTILALLGYIFYHTVAEWVGGASIGKAILGQAVIKEDGSVCDLRAAFVRNLLYPIDGLFLGLVAVLKMRDSPLRQRLGDKAASTVVAPRRILSEAQRKPAGIILLGITAGIAVDMIFGAMAILIG